MINSKKLKKLSEKLEALDSIVNLLNSPSPTAMELSGDLGVFKIVVGLSAEQTSACDLSKDLAKAFESFRIHLEREIKATVRP